MLYISLASSDQMITNMVRKSPRGRAVIRKSVELSPDQVREIIKKQNPVSACNPSHKNTLEVLSQRLNIEIPIPPKSPMVVLGQGDSLICLQALFLRRLDEGEKYTQTEIEKAEFVFLLHTFEYE